MKTICHEGFVGIDVSKDYIDIAYNHSSFRVPQTQKDIDKIIADKLIKSKPIPLLCIVESTGGYERLVVDRLQCAQLNVHIAHPLRVRDFAKAKGLLAKTDKLDAFMLSAYGAFIGADNVTPVSSETQQKLRDFQARYMQLKDMHHAESCRLGSCVDSSVKDHTQKHIIFLKEEMKIIEETIQQIISEDDSIAHQQRLLQSMKGVGIKTSQALVTHLPELGKISGKKIAALVGVAPITKQSGKQKAYAKIQYGRSQIRHVLYMAALVASKHNPVFKKFYAAMLARGKAPKVALVAIMRKMLVTLNAMVKANTEWKSPIYS